jgi:hypothetical protein
MLDIQYIVQYFLKNELISSLFAAKIYRCINRLRRNSDDDNENYYELAKYDF